jgi:arylsulfatase A-like enzyme
VRFELVTAALIAFGATAMPSAGHAQDKPNILVIWGDDIGYWNVSHNNRGMMATRRPTSTGLPAKAYRSPTTTGSRAAPPAGLPS